MHRLPIAQADPPYPLVGASRSPTAAEAHRAASHTLSAVAAHRDGRAAAGAGEPTQLEERLASRQMRRLVDAIAS